MLKLFGYEDTMVCFYSDLFCPPSLQKAYFPTFYRKKNTHKGLKIQQSRQMGPSGVSHKNLLIFLLYPGT